MSFVDLAEIDDLDRSSEIHDSKEVYQKCYETIVNSRWECSEMMGAIDLYKGLANDIGSEDSSSTKPTSLSEEWISGRSGKRSRRNFQ
jgi:hypothetical protein